MDTRYSLSEGDTPRVEHGDTVAAGDIIATGVGRSAIIAFAATLHLSADTARDEMAGVDGIVCSTGTVLGSRRVGLIKRTVLAPERGIVHALLQSGALVIRKETVASEQRATYGDIVREVSDRAIVITSDVARCEYAFADNRPIGGLLQIEMALLEGTFTDAQIPQTSTHTAVAHIADVARLKPLFRSFHGTLFVGSVTEPVAWALTKHSHTPESRHIQDPGIVVLRGVGDLAHGKQAVTPFRHFQGAQVTLNRFTQTVTIIPRQRHDE